jgi:hypothetical protein
MLCSWQALVSCWLRRAVGDDEGSGPFFVSRLRHYIRFHVVSKTRQLAS